MKPASVLAKLTVMATAIAIGVMYLHFQGDSDESVVLPRGAFTPPQPVTAQVVVQSLDERMRDREVPTLMMGAIIVEPESYAGQQFFVLGCLMNVEAPLPEVGARYAVSISAAGVNSMQENGVLYISDLQFIEGPTPLASCPSGRLDYRNVVSRSSTEG